MYDSPADQQFEIAEEEFEAAVSPPDLKGRINLRIDQMLQQELEDIAESTDYPLNKVSQVVRYCCLLGLERLRQWKPRPTLLGAIKAANAVVIRDRIQCDALDLMQRVDERVRWYIQHGHYDEAVTFVAQIRSYFEGIDDSFWRKHILKDIDDKFLGWYADIETAQNAKL